MNKNKTIDQELESLKLMAAASDLLSNCLDYEATINKVAELLVSSLSKWCAIDLLNEEGKVDRVAVSHRDKSKSLQAYRILTNYPASPRASRGVYKVIETKQSIIIPYASESMWAQRADDSEHLRLIIDLGSSSYMCVPLVARGTVVGSIMLLTDERIYNNKDLKTAERLSEKIALAVDNVRMYRRMEKAVKSRDEFLAILSHELRTPLNIIQGWVQILKNEEFNPQTFQLGIEILERNTIIQSKMIHDLLDVSRIIAGKMSMRFELVELCDLLRKAIDSIIPTVENKQLSIVTNFSTEECYVKASSSHLQRVFLNIISNAIKFTSSSGVIEINLNVEEDVVTLYFKDSGRGIDPKFLPYVFDTFKQEESSYTRTYGGLGLGLSIVKHIIDKHNGKIEILSEGRGKGATIVVQLKVAEKKSVKFVSKRNQLKSKFSLENQNILLVDDAQDMRVLLTRYLTKSGANVIAVPSAAQALENIKIKKPDLLISDIGMPNEDGYSLISKIRSLDCEERRSLKAIALTAYAQEEEKERSLQFGFNAHINKPIDYSTLVENVYRILN